MNNDEVGKLAALWLQQLSAGRPDPALTDRLALELASDDTPTVRELLAALQLQNAVAADLDEQDEWDDFRELVSLEGASLDLREGRLPGFDLTFLKTSPPPWWATEQIESALHQGRQWIQDSLQSLYVLLLPPAIAPAAAGGLRNQGGPLAHFSLNADQGFGWDVDIAAEADGESEQTCRVEVSIFRPQSDLDKVEVTLRYGDAWQRASTDASGVVIFSDIPIAALHQLVVHVSTAAS